MLNVTVGGCTVVTAVTIDPSFEGTCCCEGSGGRLTLLVLQQRYPYLISVGWPFLSLEVLF